jgi:integrase
MKRQNTPNHGRNRNRLRRRPFTEAELHKVFTIADEEWRGMMLVSVYTGLRLGDVAKLRESDVKMDSRLIQVAVNKSPLQTQPIPPPLYRYLIATCRSAGRAQPLFPHAYALATSGRISQLGLEFRHLLVKSGLREADPSAAGRDCGDGYLPLSFASLRYYFVQMLFSAEIPEQIAAQLCGHHSRLIPLFRIKPDLHAAVARLPNFQKISTERLE